MFIMFIMFNMHMCACVHMHMHVCMCAHACACVHVWDTPTHTHTHPIPIHPFTTTQGTPGIGQNSIILKLIKIFQLHLKI